MSKWYPRSAWTDSKSGCAAYLNPSEVKGVCIHYVGGNISPDVAAGKKSAVAAFLRGVRASQMASTKYDYCDIEYSVAVDSRGNVWDLRGMRLRPGSNGTSAANASYIGCFVIVGLTQNEKPTAAQIRGIRRVVERTRKMYPGAKAIKPHGAFVPTACPGAPLRRLIANGSLEPNAGLTAKARRRLRELLHALRKKIAGLTERLKRLRGRRRKVEKKLGR